MQDTLTSVDLLKAYLLQCGASAVGFANIADLAGSEIDRGFTHAISIALALPPETIVQLKEHGTRPAGADRPWCAALTELAQIACERLAAMGAMGVPLDPASGRDTLQEVIATHAGIVWVGKCAYPVAWDFGSAVRLVTVLTNAVLPTDSPVHVSFCGTCRMCTENCPAGAVKGELWEDWKPFADLVDMTACEERASNLASQGKSCRLCMAVCPFTSVYLSNCGYDPE